MWVGWDTKQTLLSGLHMAARNCPWLLCGAALDVLWVRSGDAPEMLSCCSGCSLIVLWFCFGVCTSPRGGLTLRWWVGGWER